MQEGTRPKPVQKRWDRTPSCLFDRYIRRDPDPREFLFRMLPKGAACAEIGVWKGWFSRRIVDRLAPRKLWLVDPWRFRPDLPGAWYGGALAKAQADMDAIHDDVVRNLGSLPGVTVLRAPSVEAAKSVEDGSLDWVYVDGDHSYQGVIDDLTAWLPKVRPGGLVVGDDLKLKAQGEVPVARAMKDFVARG